MSEYSGTPPSLAKRRRTIGSRMKRTASATGGRAPWIVSAVGAVSAHLDDAVDGRGQRAEPREEGRLGAEVADVGHETDEGHSAASARI